MLSTVRKGDFINLRVIFLLNEEEQLSGLESILFRAIRKAEFDVIKFLLEQEARKLNVNTVLNHSYITPLHCAVLYRHYEVVKLLVENGANLKSIDRNKETPLDKLQQSYQDLFQFNHHLDPSLVEARELKISVFLTVVIQRR
jgi:ankyrin repeat protein